MNPPPSHLYEFGDFRMDAVKRLLWRRDGAAVPLTPRVFETLLYLVQHNGVVLDKERLMEAVWPDSIVEENNLSQNISTLRRVFGEKPGSHDFIVTVPGRGYRFVAEVRTRDNATEVANELELAGEADSPELNVAAEPTALEFDLPNGKRKAQPVLLTVIAIALIGAASFFVFRGRTHNQPAASTAPTSSSTAPAPEKSIAVLPFENLSDEKENTYFAAGVQDEILSVLAKIADLKVISRTSANLYKSGNPRNSREIGQQLGVAYLLEGSVQRAGHRLRVNAQLVDARADVHLWAQTYDRDVADVFALQSEIAKTIADQLRTKISPTELAAITQPPTADLVANDLYLQALDLEFKPPQPQDYYPEAVRLLEQAVARDPQFVRAYCKLAGIHLNIYFGGQDHTPARRDLAKVAIENAARLQPDAGEVHLARARYFYYGFRDYDRARGELDLARGTLPNDPTIYFLSAAIDRRQGRFAEAVKNFERAVELDPRNREFLITAAVTYHSLRHYSDGSRFVERELKISPQDYWARLGRASRPLQERADTRPLHRELDAICAEQPEVAREISSDLFLCAMFERDSAAANRALAVIPPEGTAADTNFNFPREWFAGLAAHTFNDPEEARTAFTAARAIAEKMVRDQPDYAPAWSLLGRIDAALGRKEEAINEGRRACELLPISKDAWAGPYYVKDLALIYAWTGENDLAFEQLALLAPKGLHYGELKLDPEWDALRADPRFERLVASYAPKEVSP